MRVKIPAHLAISLAVAILCGLATIYATVPLYQSYIEKTAYPAYLETAAVGPGNVGYDAAESTPHASSPTERWSSAILPATRISRVSVPPRAVTLCTCCPWAAGRLWTCPPATPGSSLVRAMPTTPTLWSVWGKHISPWASLPFSSPVIKSSASCGSWCLSALTLFAPPF